MNTFVTVILVSCTASLCMSVSVSEQLSSAGFTRMSQMLNASGLNETVQGKGPFTIFVPNNQAFQNATVPTEKQQLTSIIKNHVVEGNLTTQNMTGSWKTLGGSPLNISKSANGTLTINNQTQITKPDIMTDNGVIHEINSLLIPSNATTSNATNQTSAAASTSGNATNATTSEQPPANASSSK